MPNTSVRAMRCASCCSTSRTWIVCWAKTSARRRRKRSMTGNNGHAPKRFAETRGRASCAFKGVLGALPLTSKGQFSRRRKLPEKQSGYLFALLAQVIPKSLWQRLVVVSGLPLMLLFLDFSQNVDILPAGAEQLRALLTTEAHQGFAPASETSFLSTPISMLCI